MRRAQRTGRLSAWHYTSKQRLQGRRGSSGGRDTAAPEPQALRPVPGGTQQLMRPSSEHPASPLPNSDHTTFSRWSLSTPRSWPACEP